MKQPIINRKRKPNKTEQLAIADAELKLREVQNRRLRTLLAIASQMLIETCQILSDVNRVGNAAHAIGLKLRDFDRSIGKAEK